MLEASFTISLVVMFIHACTWEGMILSFVPELLWNAPGWLKKILFDCPICMAPWWGSLILLFIGVFTGEFPHWIEWVLELMIAGGMNVVFSSIISQESIVRSEEIKVISLNDNDGAH